MRSQKVAGNEHKLYVAFGDHLLELGRLSNSLTLQEYYGEFKVYDDITQRIEAAYNPRNDITCIKVIDNLLSVNVDAATVYCYRAS